MFLEVRNKYFPAYRKHLMFMIMIVYKNYRKKIDQDNIICPGPLNEVGHSNFLISA
jgi:hypothetical protein